MVPLPPFQKKIFPISTDNSQTKMEYMTTMEAFTPALQHLAFALYYYEIRLPKVRLVLELIKIANFDPKYKKNFFTFVFFSSPPNTHVKFGFADFNRLKAKSKNLPIFALDAMFDEFLMAIPDAAPRGRYKVSGTFGFHYGAEESTLGVGLFWPSNKAEHPLAFVTVDGELRGWEIWEWGVTHLFRIKSFRLICTHYI